MNNVAEQFGRIKRIISRHGHRMTKSQMNSAVDIWGRLVIPATLQKSGALEIDTTEGDKKWKQRCRREDASSKNPDDSGRRTFLKRIAKPENNKEKQEKPLSPNAWRIKYPNGKVLAYHMQDNGAIKVHEVGEFTVPTYTLEQLCAMHNHATEQHEIMNNGKKENSEMQKSNQAGQLNLSALSGHQRAAVRAGLSPDTPGLEKMSFDQMKQAAFDQTRTAIADIASTHEKLYRR